MEMFFNRGEMNMKKLAFSVFVAALTFGANAVEKVEKVETTTTSATTVTGSVFDGVYFGLGIAVVDDGIKTWNSAENEVESDHKAKLAGTIALGYGRVVKEKLYLGLEAGLDASQYSEFNEREVRINGLVPSAALKLGYVKPESKSMIYLKAGAGYSRAKLTPEHVTVGYGNFKWSPIFALGGEKVFGDMRARLEAEYRFRTKKNFAGTDDKGAASNYEFTNRGAITVRVMAIYSVKM